MMLYGYPIVFLASLGVLERMNPVLEEAARMSRAGPWGVFWEITVPLMLPGLLAGALLLLMSLLGDFGIPAVIGFPARYYVLTTRIYETILNFDQRDNLNLAAALSMWLVVIAAVLLWLQRWLQRRNRFAVVGGQAGGASLVTLGRWRYPVACGLGAFVAVSVVLPLAAILVTSLIRAYGLPPAPSNLTLAHYAEVIRGCPKVPRALLNSLGTRRRIGDPDPRAGGRVRVPPDAGAPARRRGARPRDHDSVRDPRDGRGARHDPGVAAARSR